MNEKLGLKIRSLREASGLRQEDVAKEMGISRQKLARIETGKNDVNLNFLEEFSKLVSVSISEITSVLENDNNRQLAFRSATIANAGTCEAVEDMLDLFFANKDLYDRIRG